MPNNPGVSEIYDKNGVTADIEAKRFDGTRTFTLQGDVSGTQTWNGDSSTTMTLNASIGAKKVTRDKINDKAVGTSQIDDDAVGLDQISNNAMTDTVESNNSKLVTSQGVNAAIANAVLNRGKDYGPMTVDQINAIDEAIPTGSTVHVSALGSGDARVINDGYSNGSMASFSVRVSEDLRYYRSGNTHGWYSADGEFKIKQTAAYTGGIAVDTEQDATSGNDGVTFIQSFKQDTNGDITAIKKATIKGSDVTSIVTTENNYTNPGSTSTKISVLFGKVWNFIGRLRTSWQNTPDDTHFPSEKLVKDSLDTKQNKPSSATSGNIASFDSNKNTVDSGKEFLTSSSTWDGNSDTKVPTSKAIQAKLNEKSKVESSSSNGKIKVDGSDVAVYDHPTSGANTSKGDSSAQTPGFGGTFKALSATVDSMGHTTALNEHTVTIPNTTATPSTDGVGGSAGLMSASDKEKLDDLASGEATKDKDEVIAAALDDHDARIGAVEEALKDVNLGTRTADVIDAQVLKIGGDDVAPSLASKVNSVKMVNSSGTELKDANGNVVIPLAVATGTTGATAGAMSAEDKMALNDLKTGAVTDVKYVSNQSGGGGSLKKTVNGTDSVVMNFMTDAEVDALFDNAMAAAIAAA